MNIAVIGTGYVGLVAGSCFAESGNDVCCVDNDIEKIESLRKGIVKVVFNRSTAFSFDYNHEIDKLKGCLITGFGAAD